MWKPLPAANKNPPFNEVAHLNAQTLSFVCNLRAPSQDYDDWMKKLTPEERTLIEAENKVKKREINKVCRRPECKAVVESIALQVLEKAAVSRRIDEVNSQFTDFEEMVHELTSTLHSIEKESDELTAQLEALRHKDRIELKKKLQSSQNLKHTLEREIAHAHKEIEKIIAGKEESKSAGSNRGNTSSLMQHNDDEDAIIDGSLVFGRAHSAKHEHIHKKHSGVYEMGSNGVKIWSCCHIDDDEMSGCADDHSIGVKSVLVIKNRQSYRPFQAMKDEIARKQMFSKLNRPATSHVMNKGFRDRLDAQSLSLNLPSMSLKSLSRAETSPKIHSILMNTSSSTFHNDTNNSNSNNLNQMGATKSGQFEATAFPSGFNSLGGDHAAHSVHFATSFSSTTMQQQSSSSNLHRNIRSAGASRSMTLTAGSLLAASNAAVSSKNVGLRRMDETGKSISRVGGRPLTAQSGIHLINSTTVTPSSCLQTMCTRIV